jgi:hypothetical protein
MGSGCPYHHNTFSHPNYLKQALKVVMKDGLESVLECSAVQDTVNQCCNCPLEIQPAPQLLLTFLPRLKDHQNLDSSDILAGDDNDHLRFLIDVLETEYAPTLHKIANLVNHGEITFDLRWAIFPPAVDRVYLVPHHLGASCSSITMH